jgi:hypothetical protein
VWSRGNAAVSAGQGRQRQRGARAATRHRPHPVGRARACRCARRRRRLHQPPPHGFFKKPPTTGGATRGRSPRPPQSPLGRHAGAAPCACGWLSQSQPRAGAGTHSTWPRYSLATADPVSTVSRFDFSFLAMSLYSGERGMGSFSARTRSLLKKTF